VELSDPPHIPASSSSGRFYPQKNLNHCYKIKGNSVNNRDIFKVHISVRGSHCHHSAWTQKKVATPLVVARNELGLRCTEMGRMTAVI
jgi:hypothetical protein